MLTQLKSKILALCVDRFVKPCMIFFCCLLLNSCSNESTGPQLTGMTMGTSYSVQWHKLPSTTDANKLRIEIENRLEEINALMSTYIPNSQLSGFNLSRETGWHAVELELAQLVTLALKISEQSQGAFDVTVGPLVNLWGFGPSDAEFVVPTRTEINIARRGVGYKYLEARLDPPALNKKVVDLYVDLSAIAKGYAVDEVALLLDAANIENYMVEIGGEIKGKGIASHGEAWRIGIETPENKRGNIEAVLSLENVGVATSGDYRNVFELDDNIYSHTIDPRTGKPISHNLASITVVHDSVAIADAWATAFLVLGPKQTYEISNQKEMAVLFIMREANNYKTTSTDAMKKYLVQ